MKTLKFRTPDNHEFTIESNENYNVEENEVIQLKPEHFRFLADLIGENRNHAEMLMESFAEAMSLINVDLLDSRDRPEEQHRIVGTLIGLGSAYKQFQKLEYLWKPKTQF